MQTQSVPYIYQSPHHLRSAARVFLETDSLSPSQCLCQTAAVCALDLRLRTQNCPALDACASSSSYATETRARDRLWWDLSRWVWCEWCISPIQVLHLLFSFVQTTISVPAQLFGDSLKQRYSAGIHRHMEFGKLLISTWALKQSPITRGGNIKCIYKWKQCRTELLQLKDCFVLNMGYTWDFSIGLHQNILK